MYEVFTGPSTFFDIGRMIVALADDIAANEDRIYSAALFKIVDRIDDHLLRRELLRRVKSVNMKVAEDRGRVYRLLAAVIVLALELSGIEELDRGSEFARDDRIATSVIKEL